MDYVVVLTVMRNGVRLKDFGVVVWLVKEILSVFVRLLGLVLLLMDVIRVVGGCGK